MTDDVVLLLPGMTLNASVFPDFGMRAVTMDFTRLVVSPTGWSAELATKRMGFYVERLREQLQRHPAWSGAARRVAV
ncbi:MAG: hypothetical protein HYW06_03270, partial [Gemmatimonadetes bacterium]|nr:hypothetical protein [Gemmatimonadota bacterium]